ncbi:hypothetical protein JTB14_001426, partial [Gonioctena quinquepunctata]
ALGAVGGGAASIASAVNKVKAERKQLAEQKKHNIALERKGNGMYLRLRIGYGM